MTNLLDTLNITAEQVNNIEAASVANGQRLKSGIYEGVVDTLQIFNTKKGAKMLKEVFVIEGDEKAEFSNFTTIVNKDGKPNEIGMRRFKGIVAAAKQEMSELELIETKGKYFATDDVDCSQIKLQGFRAVSLFVREVNQGDKEFSEVEGVFDREGANADGEDQKETFLAKIEKKPVIVRKEREPYNPTGSDDAGKKEKAKQTSTLRNRL